MANTKKPREIRICEQCKEEFEIICTSKKIFCSLACSNRATAIKRTKINLVDLFWKRVLVEDENKCWIPVSKKSRKHYWTISGNYAHRFSWSLHNGPIPVELQINHHCDNPCCVNPKHLYAGTPQQNVDDMIKRGRNSPSKGLVSGIAAICRDNPDTFRGENSPVAKLTDSDVREIRRRYVRASYKRSNTKELAKEFGVCDVTIQHVISGKGWSHVK